MNELTEPAIDQMDSSDQRPLYRRVEEYIESLIHSGGIKPGESIPSLSQLTKTLGVNPLTVRRAIRELTFKRILVTLQGRGTFVSEGAIKRVLWVSGQNLFGGDISSYYTDLFRHAALECEKHRIVLQPVWQEADRAFDMTLNANGGESAILGYFFCGCLPHHRLLNHVIKAGKPFISLSASHYGKPRCVFPNLVQADQLAFEHLLQSGAQRIIAISMHEIAEETIQKFSQKCQLEHISARAQSTATKSRIEENGYFWAKELFKKVNPEGLGIYIADDVIARGATRAMLELHGESNQQIKVIVQSSRESIIPLGIPVSYVCYDIAEQATHAVQMLVAQMNGWETPLQYYTNFRIFNSDQIAAPTREIPSLATAAA